MMDKKAKELEKRKRNHIIVKMLRFRNTSISSMASTMCPLHLHARLELLHEPQLKLLAIVHDHLDDSTEVAIATVSFFDSQIHGCGVGRDSDHLLEVSSSQPL